MHSQIRKLLAKMPVSLLRFVLNRYRPYKGASIKTLYIAKDYRHIKVAMPLKWYNRNYLGTHFGGSLFSMTDAFYPLMLSQLLGKNYIIWDKESSIKYLKPGTTTVYCEFKLDQASIEEIISQTIQHGKIHWQKEVKIHDKSNELIAIVTRTIYIKDKRFSDKKLLNN